MELLWGKARENALEEALRLTRYASEVVVHRHSRFRASGWALGHCGRGRVQGVYRRPVVARVAAGVMPCELYGGNNLWIKTCLTNHFKSGLEFTLHQEHLDEPRRWRKPRRVFVNSMSDLFHERMPDDSRAIRRATP